MSDKLPETGTAGEECTVLRQLATAHLKELRAARRWGIFFRLLSLALVVAVIVLVRSPWAVEGGSSGSHTAMVEVSGVIADGTDAGADSVNQMLREAFEDKGSKGVIVKINSPGGTPVQAARINREITRLRAKYPDKPLYAVVSDVCASGGYYVAAAAEKIYVSEASMVGSIGVRLDSFGVEKVMEKLGVERRTITAGEHKAILDPFAPQSEFERQHLKAMIEGVHTQFIDAVKAGRGDRLTQSDELFSGLIWNGNQAVKLGLADALGDEDLVARDVFGEETILLYAPQKTLFEEFTQGVGTAMLQALQQLAPATLM